MDVRYSASDLPPTRYIDTHKVNPANDRLTVRVLDGEGSGGACHLYEISGFNSRTNPSDPWTKRHGQPSTYSTVLFQNGPIGEAGVNGVTHEALLAILIDRMQSFQCGPYACEENAVALLKLQEAAHWLGERTRRRTAAGIEGTHAKDKAVK